MTSRRVSLVVFMTALRLNVKILDVTIGTCQRLRQNI
jgi:hypothetical protein